MKHLLILTIGVFLTYCGADPQQKEYEDESPSGAFQSNGSGSEEGEQVLIPVGVNYATEGFSLAGATAYDFDLDGCASGLTASVDETNTGLRVYKFDQGCLAKLTGFEYGGVTYQPKAADPFTTWAAGDQALFEDVLAVADDLRVEVSSQLDDPISGTEAVVYIFGELIQGTTETVANAVVSDDHTLAVNSEPPPNFSITTVTMDGMTAGGAGQFSFELTCANALVGQLCDSVDMADITYKLVEDTYGSTLSFSDAETIMSAGTSATSMPGDMHAVGNGGFDTSTLDGPATINSKPNMILVLKAGLSFQYFNVDITAISQP